MLLEQLHRKVLCRQPIKTHEPGDACNADKSQLCKTLLYVQMKSITPILDPPHSPNSGFPRVPRESAASIAPSLVPAAGGDSFRADFEETKKKYQGNRLVRQVDLTFGRKRIHFFCGSFQQFPECFYLLHVLVNNIYSICLPSKKYYSFLYLQFRKCIASMIKLFNVTFSQR